MRDNDKKPRWSRARKGWALAGLIASALVVLWSITYVPAPENSRNTKQLIASNVVTGNESGGDSFDQRWTFPPGQKAVDQPR